MKKSFIISSLTALAAFCLCVTAQAQGPVVVSDKDDYSPGETALFSTTGFQPGELLDFSVAIGGDDGTWVPDIAWADVPADATGSAIVDYIVPETWANKTLQLTVMGLTSGLMATTTFTDAPNPVHNVNFSTSGPLPAGTSITVSGTKINPPGNNATYSDTFVTPASSNDEGTRAFDTVCFPIIGCLNFPTNLTFTGFPTSVPGTGGNWVLSSFTLGPLGTDNGTLHDLDVSTGSGQYLTGGENTGNGHVHSTIVGNYTFVPNGTPNSPPVITCLDPATVDLGQAVGCLGNDGFCHNFPITYTQNGPGTTVTVTAHITKPDSNVVDVDVATVTDPDGDIVMVTLDNGTNPVAICGPGTPATLTPFSVDIHADDGHSTDNTADSNCGGDATAQIVYDFHGFFPPLSGQTNTKVKQGSGIPVKFSITDCAGNSITTGDHTISVVYQSGVTPDGDPTVDDSGQSGDNGINFRYDPVGLQWIFNLKTNNTYYVGATYQITAHLDDGTDHSVSIAIKR